MFHVFDHVSRVPVLLFLREQLRCSSFSEGSQSSSIIRKRPHLTPTAEKMELFIQKNIIYTIYTEDVLCISSFTTFCIN